MKKILLLTTDGAPAGPPPGLAAFCHTDTRAVMERDSANIQPEEWLQLAQSVYQALDIYDGFVITHDAGTLAYSAAALSFMLHGLDKPVILTGSSDPGELTDAFSVAAADKPGVYVVCAGKIIRGCRAVKLRAQGAEAFFSVNAPLAGMVAKGGIEWLSPLPAPQGPRALAAHCQSRVLLLKLAPGMEADIVEAAIILGYRGLVVEGYGAGNIPHLRRNISAALAKAIHSGLAVAVTSQCLLDAGDMSSTEPGRILQGAGAIPGLDMTTEALYVKLAWALGKTTEPAELRAIMAQNIAGEME